jgi:phosphoglycerate dehydrogenase-like enzyme
MEMKVVFLYPLSQDAYNYLEENLPTKVKVVAKIRDATYDGVQPNQDPKIIAEAQKAEILMGPYVTDEILSKAVPEAGGKLKLVFIPWAGVDRLNFDLLMKYNVPVANSHGNARTIAEHTIALLLAAAKNLIYHDRLLREGNWQSRFREKHSMLLEGKTVGLLGFGAIGTETAKLLQPFNVELIACRNNPEKTTKEQRELVQDIYSSDDLYSFLGEIDILINSLPLTSETESIIDQKAFEKMKDEIIVVNVGRGPTIDEKAFYQAVQQGQIIAAGLDPQWQYPPRGPSEKEFEPTYPSKYPIHDYETIVLSPHRAGDIGQYERAHWADVVENIIRVFEGKAPFNVIDKEKEY